MKSLIRRTGSRTLAPLTFAAQQQTSVFEYPQTEFLWRSIRSHLYSLTHLSRRTQYGLLDVL